MTHTPGADGQPGCLRFRLAAAASPTACATPLLITPPMSTLARLLGARVALHLGGPLGQGVDRAQLPKHAHKTGKANTMADLFPHRLHRALPPHRLLAPGAHNPDRTLARDGLARLR